MAMETALCALGVLLLLETWRSHRQLSRPLARRARRAAPGLAHHPSITVIHPVRGVDSGARENIAAALDATYPGDLDRIYVFDDACDPALPLLQEAIAERRGRGQIVPVKIIYCGQPPPERTGKLNAMIAGLAAARGELIAFVDSDIRPSADATTRLVEQLLTTPSAGAAFAPVVVTEPAVTVGDAAYALLLNGLYGPAAAAEAAANGGTLPFIMGQFMVLRRETIAAIGGLETAQGQLVDDMYLGLRVQQTGRRNAVSDHRVAVIQHDLPLGRFLGLFTRWLAFSRSGLPARSKRPAWTRGGVVWLGLLAGVAALGLHAPIAAALNLAALLAVSSSINRLHRRFGGSPLRARHRWVSTALLLTGPLVLLRLLFCREIHWRGRAYPLDSRARLGGASRAHSTDRV